MLDVLYPKNTSLHHESLLSTLFLSHMHLLEAVKSRHVHISADDANTYGALMHTKSFILMLLRLFLLL